MKSICDDLDAETAELDPVLAGLSEQDWSVPTPAVGFTVRDQVTHLASGDVLGSWAVRDAVSFEEEKAKRLRGEPAFMTDEMARMNEMSGAEALEWFRKVRAEMTSQFRGLDSGARIPWFGPDMGARMFATARLMETWAHGQDVLDTFGLTREPTDRIRSIAHIGVRTRGWTYTNRGLEVPPGEVRVELQAPSGGIWRWNEDVVDDSVRGNAEDFCLVVTQRRHLDDTALVVEGDLARDWMRYAQAFAGPPTDGREPGAV